MKRLLMFGVMMLGVCALFAQGVPFLRNYMPKDYNAHKLNFDVVTDKDGVAYFANFEGLLYYDNAEWRIIHTPGITRVTVVCCDKNNRIWVGGYNYFGYIDKKENGELYLKQLGRSSTFQGEVVEIWESGEGVEFLISNGNIYQCVNNKLEYKKQASLSKIGVGMQDIVNTDLLDGDNKVVVLKDITQTESLGNGMMVNVIKEKGLSFTDEKGRELFTLTEANGLCSNDVVWVAYDGRGVLWGATANGIFSIAVPSAFTHFTSHEGLIGDVRSIEEYGGHVYVATSRALYRREGQRFVTVSGIDHACWDLKKSRKGLLAATANGIYCVTESSVRHLTTTPTLALLDDGSQFYSGEMNAVFLTQFSDYSRKKVCGVEKVNKICRDVKGVVWLQTMYGEVWRKDSISSGFKPYRESAANDISTIVPLADGMEVVRTTETVPFSYPMFSYLDDSGINWLTNNEGKELYRWKNGKRLSGLDYLLYPIADIAVRAMYVHEDEVWIGGDDELRVINVKQSDPALQRKPLLKIRSVTLNGDSILWGGFGKMPQSLPELGSHERNLRFTYSLDQQFILGEIQYRHRLNGGRWSVWDDDKEVEFLNLSYGSYTFEIQARMANGQLSDIVPLYFSIAYPFYMRWYMGVFYVLLFGLFVMLLFRYRLHRLNMEKQKLERVVQERTSEVVKQKDEIEEKSKSLEKALDDLHNAQHELIRQEKMATVGKLTQGLIDRILNPLNYINNFSKLSEGLIKDVEANIEDEKEKMEEENYEDTMDVLDMLRGNLQKVSEHGQNTTRTLKAMEEMLKDRTGGIVPMSLSALLKQDADMLNTYYADDISKYGIQIVFSIPEGDIRMNGNGDQLSKMIMSILGNAVYAIVKKAQREKPMAGQPKNYVPEISFKAEVDEGNISVIIRDNGIGIEETIIEKIFDPFFTTKTTGEAAGVGLYLSREIVQNHGGDIHVKSVKNDYSEFTITLPTLKS